MYLVKSKNWSPKSLIDEGPALGLLFFFTGFLAESEPVHWNIGERPWPFFTDLSVVLKMWFVVFIFEDHIFFMFQHVYNKLNLIAVKCAFGDVSLRLLPCGSSDVHVNQWKGFWNHMLWMNLGALDHIFHQPGFSWNKGDWSCSTTGPCSWGRMTK